MAVQTFNIDESMVTCNMLTYCRSISVKKKKNSRIVLVSVILFFDRALGRFLGHNLFWSNKILWNHFFLTILLSDLILSKILIFQ